MFHPLAVSCYIYIPKMYIVYVLGTVLGIGTVDKKKYL